MLVRAGIVSPGVIEKVYFMRHTMGQDVGLTRPKLNPDNAPRVNRKQVIDAANEVGARVK